MKQNCKLVEIRLNHVSGYLTCSKQQAHLRSRWGCSSTCYTCLRTILVKDNTYFVPEKFSGLLYQRPGFYVNDDALIFKKNANLTAGEKIQVWYNDDWIDATEGDNGGRHCIDIDVSCLV